MASHLELRKIGSLRRNGYFQYKVYVDSIDDMEVLLVRISMQLGDGLFD